LYSKQIKIRKKDIKQLVAAISVGICNGNLIVDLDYSEDVNADTDMNIVMNDDGNFIEIQGTAEHHTFTQDELISMLDLAKIGLKQLFDMQKEQLNYKE
jgi:ribonuclease PH